MLKTSQEQQKKPLSLKANFVSQPQPSSVQLALTVSCIFRYITCFHVISRHVTRSYWGTDLLKRQHGTKTQRLQTSSPPTPVVPKTFCLASIVIWDFWVWMLLWRALQCTKASVSNIISHSKCFFHLRDLPSPLRFEFRIACINTPICHTSSLFSLSRV